MLTTFSTPTSAITMLETVLRAGTLRLLVVGALPEPTWPFQTQPTLRCVAADASVAVTFMTTAPTPVVGTPPRPRTVTDSTWPGPKGPSPSNVPSMVGFSAADTGRATTVIAAAATTHVNTNRAVRMSFPAMTPPYPRSVAASH